MSFLDRFRRQRGQGNDAAPNSGDFGAEPAVERDSETVAGERGVSAVQRPPSLQSRVSNALAAGLMGLLAVGFLGWYYVNSLGSRNSAKAAAESSAKEKAKGEMVLRPLGRVEPPPPTRAALENLLGEAPEEPPPPDIPEAWLRPAVETGPNYGTRAPAGKSPEELRLERLLAGAAFSSASRSTAQGPTPPGGQAGAASEELEEFLRPSVTTAVSAKVLPTQRLLLPKGAFLDCTLETAIDSGLPGMTTCVLATDTFSADGSVVLLERGTKLVGETRGQVRAGSARVFVLWTEARTPKGVVVALASGGTDELGRSGLPGKANRHFFERFGAAILVSVIDGAVQAASQSQGEGDDTVVVNPTSSSQVMTEVLKSTISIPPTVAKPQGDRIAIVVARDLDFRTVYELRAVSR
jgi:type IV secretion system protein VirB10